MAMNSEHRSAELEREVEAQRSRVESTIGEIQDRLSPGQLIDEMLSYTKHGGAHFAANLGHTLSANPLPAALLGVSLAWLMTGSKSSAEPAPEWSTRHVDPVYGRVSGNSLTRRSHGIDDSGDWYSEFEDAAGARYRARSNEQGHRTGNFVDGAGKAVTGFIDETGRHMNDFRDEAGNAIDAAAGWANHTWHDMSSAMGGGLDAVSRQARGVADSAMQMGGQVQQQASRMTRDAMSMLESQPLIMGALAFAAGAALGATLPHTEQEDALLGEAADSVKEEAAGVAADLYDRGKEKASELYEDVSAKAGEVYEDARDKIANGGARTSQPGMARH